MDAQNVDIRCIHWKRQKSRADAQANQRPLASYCSCTGGRVSFLCPLALPRLEYRTTHRDKQDKHRHRTYDRSGSYKVYRS